MRDAVEVFVDGRGGTLIDLSNVGAQILSRGAVRPNQSVGLLLPRAEGSVRCKGRVVWVLSEPSGASEVARYRVGVRFDHVDAPALDAFMIKHA